MVTIDNIDTEILNDKKWETISKLSLQETTVAAAVSPCPPPPLYCVYRSSCCSLLSVRWFDRIPRASLYCCSSHLLISWLRNHQVSPYLHIVRHNTVAYFIHKII